MNRFSDSISKFLSSLPLFYNVKLTEFQTEFQQDGGSNSSDIEYQFADIGGVYTFNVYIKESKDTVQISVITEKENDCAIIIIEKKEKVAIITNMAYDKDCAKEGLMKPGGGTILLKFIINLILWNKHKYKINRIVLTDNSYINCKDSSETIKLSRLRILLKGYPWYTKYGFKPYSGQTMKPSTELLKDLHENAKVHKTIKISDVDIIGIMKKVKLSNITIDELKSLLKETKNLRELVTKLMEKPETYCQLVQKILDELFKTKLNKKKLLHDFYGKQFYLDI